MRRLDPDAGRTTPVHGLLPAHVPGSNEETFHEWTMTLSVLRAVLVSATLLPLASISVAAPLLDTTPSRAWLCQEKQPKPGRPMQRATLYFFDTPIEADRYTPETGLDQVDGINTVVEVAGAGGLVSEYTFGVFSLDYQAYEITMRFSARMTPDGPKLLNFPQSATVTIIDRITGEMRAAGMEPGSGQISCETVAGTFQQVARAYDQLMIDAMRMHKGSASR